MKILEKNTSIIIAPFLCAVLIVFTKLPLEYYPLSFGLVIAVVNWKISSRNSYLRTFLCVLFSYTSFFAGYFTPHILSNAFVPLFGQDIGGIVALTLSVCLISPLLLFFLFRFIFKYPKKKFVIKVTAISVITLFLISLFHTWNVDTLKFQHEFNEILNPYTLWQVIMALAIQLLVRQQYLFKQK
ncbi:MAG: hypothetical protein GKR88_12240 [Flavobacteriaceae bacterium]|nr:MAG: hypothetical protein GKR88_12240 [Flavobacteriaceae bacterium]